MVLMSTVVSYILLEHLLLPSSVSLIMHIPIEQVPLAFQNSSNAFTGILVGFMSANLYNRYSHIQLPKAFSFFSGKRFVPLICTFMTLIVALTFMIIWPNLFNVFIDFGEFISRLGPLGAGIYGFFNRLLIPTGLHHALNSVFWFDMAGINDIGKFWGTIEGGVLGETGMYQAGFFPIMMFGLPAAALAMIQCARPEKRKKVGAILLSAAFASFLTGVTEPIEFLFMFVAPSLYFIHAILTGVFVFIAASMEWIAGFGFSAGLFDYLLSIKAPFSHHIFMLIPLGMVCGFIYYFLFKFMIIHYHLMTPGREIDDVMIEVPEQQVMTIDSDDYDELAIIYVEALGGKTNIISIESCITRLRVQVKDMSLLDEKTIISTGVGGIVKMGKSGLQIIIGPQVDFIVDSINDILN